MSVPEQFIRDWNRAEPLMRLVWEAEEHHEVRDPAVVVAAEELKAFCDRWRRGPIPPEGIRFAVNAEFNCLLKYHRRRETYYLMDLYQVVQAKLAFMRAQAMRRKAPLRKRGRAKAELKAREAMKIAKPEYARTLKSCVVEWPEIFDTDTRFRLAESGQEELQIWSADLRAEQDDLEQIVREEIEDDAHPYDHDDDDDDEGNFLTTD